MSFVICTDLWHTLVPSMKHALGCLNMKLGINQFDMALLLRKVNLICNLPLVPMAAKPQAAESHWPSDVFT